MKEINIGKVLIAKRKEAGITQEDLANYIGVSKASVSKWETEQCYPDVTFLPQLAAYFNITIDELMDYQPQMKPEDIRALYKKLSARFAVEAPEAVLEECRAVIRKYYSCFPLLLQMGILMINHLELVKDQEKINGLVREAKELFVRVRTESGEIAVIRQAVYMEALCSLTAGEPDAVLTLLGPAVEPALPPESLLSAAYQAKGLPQQAKSVLQAGIYQNIVVLFNFLPAYMMLCAKEPERFEETLRRTLSIADAFDVKHLNPWHLANLYAAAAQGYMLQEKPEKALDMLERYAGLAAGNIDPLRLHGDSYFDLLEEWLETLDLGGSLPRDEKTVRKSMTDLVVANPFFAPLAEDARYKLIIRKLKGE